MFITRNRVRQISPLGKEIFLEPSVVYKKIVDHQNGRKIQQLTYQRNDFKYFNLANLKNSEDISMLK